LTKDWVFVGIVKGGRQLRRSFRSQRFWCRLKNSGIAPVDLNQLWNKGGNSVCATDPLIAQAAAAD